MFLILTWLRYTRICLQVVRMHSIFFHSQVKIKIEYSCSMLVYQQTILCRPIPANVLLSKVTALTCYSCKLRNFCTNEREVEYCKQTQLNSFNSSVSRAYAVDANEEGNILSEEVLHRGKHSNNFNRQNVPADNNACEKMLEIVREKDLCRPILKG